jgi:type III pantothenate kinase
MELVLDVGNTRIKAAIFDKSKITELIQFHRETELDLLAVFCQKHRLLPAIVADVAVNNPTTDYIFSQLSNLHRFSYKSRLPFTINYKTPQTLGADRLAACAGAVHLFPNKHVLVIDAGTCITYDLVSKSGQYEGGAISPGLYMRYKALTEFTGKLPLIKHRNFEELTGKSTEESILSGVQNGIIAELTNIIEQYKVSLPDLHVVICGGDAPFLAKRLKCNIFAEPNLVLAGLYYILTIHAQ